jgi:hypothetical protein
VDKASLLRACATIAEVPGQSCSFVVHGGIGPGRLVRSDWLLLTVRPTSATAGKRAFSVVVAPLSGLPDQLCGTDAPRQVLLPLDAMRSPGAPAGGPLLVCVDSAQVGGASSRGERAVRVVAVDLQHRELAERPRSVPEGLLALVGSHRLLACHLAGPAAEPRRVVVVAVPRSASSDKPSHVWTVEASADGSVRFYLASCSHMSLGQGQEDPLAGSQLVAADVLASGQTRLTFVSAGVGAGHAFDFWQVKMPARQAVRPADDAAQSPAHMRTVATLAPACTRDPSG